MVPRLVPLALGLVAACVVDGGPAAPLGSGQQAIVGGELDPGDAAVVALVHGGQQYCSGTLVAPRVVVSAAHCLPPHLAFAAEEIEVYFGDAVDQGGASVAASSAKVNQLWTQDLVSNDIGMLALAADAPADPLPMIGEGYEAVTGEQVKLVGFGITSVDGEDNGVKRMGFAVIEDADDSTLYLDAEPALTCNGDSGGPLFVSRAGTWVFAGIHSRSDCEAESLNERVDVHLASEIDPFIADNGGGSCGIDGTCNADCAVDLDCEGGDLSNPRADFEGGCAAGGGGAGSAAWLALVGLALLIGLGRRPRAVRVRVRARRR